MSTITKQRHAILKLLYDARINETRVIKGYVTLKDIVDAVGECEFNLGVLDELNHIDRQGYKARIIGAGVLAYETAEH